MPLSVIPQGHLPPDFSQHYQAVSGLGTADFISALFGDEARFGPVAAVISFGAESAVLLHLIASVAPDAPILFIDTGFHFSETLQYRDQLVNQFRLSSVKTIQLDPLSEKRSDSSGKLHAIDPDACCALRKVSVLQRALTPYSGWVAGQKRFHSYERSRIDRLEWDADQAKWKFNPLADWSASDLMRYQTQHQLPAHPLAAAGFSSIGCAPCTTAAGVGEDVRAGRWRGTQKRECGLHRSADLIVVSGS